jgi:DHA1 family bicyclomycin/chloramphenicol resistance-like MFS transporter
LLALLSQNFTMMLAGRLLQGIGVAGPRTITIALVRDRFEGREMARVMSLVTAVFIVAPIVAPTMGQVLLGLFGWRAIFVVYLAMGLVTSVWFGLRQEETLPAARRMPFSWARLATAARQVVTNRVTAGYTVASGFVFGAFLGYLTSAQQILQEQYALGAFFTVYFSALAIAIGGASLANARLVLRYGMRPLSRWALWGILIVSVVFLGVSNLSSGHPPLLLLMAYLMASFFGIGLLFGNLTTMAMQPLGAIAGTGSAIVGATSMLISLTLGTAIGQSYNGTVTPLVGGFAILSLCSLAAARFAERGGAPETDPVLVSGADVP